MIFQFWTGPRPEYIDFCMKSVERHNPGQVEVLTSMPDECRDFYRIPPSAKFKAAHEADILRAWLLEKYGGYWIDCDFVCFRPIAFHSYNKVDFRAYKRKIEGGYLFDNDFVWAASSYTWYTTVWRARVAAYLRHTNYEVRDWGAVGGSILTEIINEYKDGTFAEIPIDFVSPLRYMAYQWDAPAVDSEIESAIRPDALGMMLVNSVCGHYLKDKRVEDVLQSDTVLGAIFRKSLRGTP